MGRRNGVRSVIGVMWLLVVLDEELSRCQREDLSSERARE